MGPYKPLRTWVDEFIPHYMEIMGVDRPWGHKSPIATNDSLQVSSCGQVISVTMTPGFSILTHLAGKMHQRKKKVLTYMTLENHHF